MTGKTKHVWRLEVGHLFEKKLAKLPRTDREQILSALEKLQHLPSPLPGPLKGDPVGGCESVIGGSCCE